jgi:hypothetical protein
VTFPIDDPISKVLCDSAEGRFFLRDVLEGFGLLMLWLWLLLMVSIGELGWASVWGGRGGGRGTIGGR